VRFRLSKPPKDGGLAEPKRCIGVAASALAKAEADFKKAKRLGNKNPGEQCHEALAELRDKAEAAARKNRKRQNRNVDYDTEQEAPSGR